MHTDSTKCQIWTLFRSFFWKHQGGKRQGHAMSKLWPTMRRIWWIHSFKTDCEFCNGAVHLKIMSCCKFIFETQFFLSSQSDFLIELFCLVHHHLSIFFIFWWGLTFNEVFTPPLLRLSCCLMSIFLSIKLSFCDGKWIQTWQSWSDRKALLVFLETRLWGNLNKHNQIGKN